MQKHLFLLLVSLILTGCFGGGDEGDAAPSNGGTPTTTAPVAQGQAQGSGFTIAGNTWNVTFPAGWRQLPPPDGANGAVLLAQNQTANFVILQKVGADTVSVDALLQEAQRDYYSFQAGASNANQWSFTGKLKATEPTRRYMQRIQTVPGTNNYLYASCAYETNLDYSAQCQSILSSWQRIAQ